MERSMSGEPESLMLVFLRRLDVKMDGLAEAVADLKHRMTAVEIQLGSMASTEQSHYASLALRLDRHEARLERIERRLDLVDGPAA
jgi:hypothetical protein